MPLLEAGELDLRGEGGASRGAAEGFLDAPSFGGAPAEGFDRDLAGHFLLHAIGVDRDHAVTRGPRAIWASVRIPGRNLQ